MKEKLTTYQVSSMHLLEKCPQKEQANKFPDLLRHFYKAEDESQTSTPFCWGKSGSVDAKILSKIMPSDTFLQRFKYGMIISLEEQACLLELQKRALEF